MSGLPKSILITLGGNAILPARGTGTFDEQSAITRLTMQPIAELIRDGVQVVLSHGNGPIVGNILIRNEAARDQIPPMPLDVCGADSQGGIGFMMQQALQNELRRVSVDRTVVTLVTQVVVDERDPAFRRPTKPIGPFYSQDRARLLAKEKGWTVVEDAGRGWRRVVASPRPLEVVEIAAIRKLVADGVIAIAAGGGGIPVARQWDGSLHGVEAVIDKDLASSLLARLLGCEMLCIVTGVDRVALNYGKPDQRDLDCATAEELSRYAAEGHFPSGSMGPKIQAAIEFVRGGGREVVITSPAKVLEALQGKGGTRIRRE
ncbi:MAG: carbamate kinase [Candidatus Eisenbacteria bacterium]|uniref:Carbamate kinase n=1 Tax=Eiseniibacteriota bacterium TaxID=2212470 RepID=A0A538TH85_UNCEI|nr:MAG: carbamate kinase [Candidatus Eisenbacteria bacterium]